MRCGSRRCTTSMRCRGRSRRCWREVERGCDRLRRRLPLRPVPARDRRDHPLARRARAARQLRGPRRGLGAGRARGGGSRMAPVPAARGDCRRRSLLPCGPGRQHSDHHRRDARRRGQADLRRSHRHDRDRAHAPSVRPARRRPAHRQRGLGRHGVRGRRRGVLDAASSTASRRPMRTPFDVDRAVRETSASGWPHAQEFVAENLLQAVAREEAIASLESRR